MSRGQREVIIVGTGIDGAAYLAEEVESWAKANDVSLLIEPSCDAIAKLNELVEQKKTIAFLSRTTC